MLDIKGADLNLLVSLDTLLDEANVTRAAARLGVSQPGLSAQLARLRELFGDALLVPSETGRGMLPTARALALRAPLHAALQQLRAALRQSDAFDPLTDERHFCIAASDNTTLVIGLPLVKHLRDNVGPGVRLSFQPSRAGAVGAQLERGEIDLLLGPQHIVPPTMKARKLFDETYVMVQRREHPRGTAALALDDYCALDHVLVSPSGGSLRGFIDEQLEQIGHQRRVVLSVHQFVAAALAVQATDCVATLPRRFAQQFTSQLDLFDLPFDAQGFSVYAAWHPRSQSDTAHAWLRNILVEVVTTPG